MRSTRLVTLLLILACAGSALAAPRPVTLATTTSTHDTGLLDYLVPEFERRTGIDVKVIAVGTGQALEIGRRGDADLVLVHAPDLERQFMREGHASGHWRLMYNHFVIVGPTDDPAGLRSTPTPAAAMNRIADARAAFVSRGDESGTHHRETMLWKAARIKPEGNWYVEAGSGMAATLRIADEKDAYTLSDIGTYLVQKGNLRLAVLYEKGNELLNPYGLMAISPRTHPSINHSGAMRLVHYFLAPETLKRIGSFGADRFGRSLFRIYKRPAPAR